MVVFSVLQAADVRGMNVMNHSDVFSATYMDPNSCVNTCAYLLDLFKRHILGPQEPDQLHTLQKARDRHCQWLDTLASAVPC